MADPFADPVLENSKRPRRDSLFLRRVVGGAFIAGLVVLGLVFSMII